MKKAISIDWLSIQYLGMPEKTFPWSYKLLPYSSKEFKELYEIYYGNELFGHYSFRPQLPSLPENLGILKVENRFLYCQCLQQILKEFVWDCKVQYKGLSRVDICADFNKFEGGKSPEKLIRNYMAGTVDCLNKMGCNCVRGPKGDDPYEYLAFGSRRSDVRVYLYNKTKEMADKTYKTWIVDYDTENGVDWNETVWRLEVSLKGTAKKWYSKETGEAIDIQLNDLFDDGFLHELFNSLRGKYFRFIHHSTGKNRYQDKEIALWDDSFAPIHRLYSREKEDVNRADRIFAKKLCQELNQNRAHHSPDTPFMVMWALAWIEDHRLMEYCRKRTAIPSW